MKRPLESLRILTIESFGAGPYASMFLADLGATVIKVENPATGGDASRSVGPHFLGEQDSHYFQTFNRNKKSIGLDLKSDEGQEVFTRIAAGGDAVLNNLRGDLPAKLGLDYRSLKAHNPAIVCAHLSAYGRDNERTAWPGYDYLMQAEAGFMTVTGEPDGPPTRMGLSIVDFITGLMSAIGLLAAINGARESGVGCDVDVSLFDAALHQLSYPATWYLNEGTVVGRNPRSAHPSVAPVQLYTTKDGWIMIMCMKDKFWERLLEGLGRQDLADVAEFRTAAARRDNADLLTRILDGEFVRKTTAEWVTILGEKLPAAPVMDVADALDNPYVARVGMVEDVPHPHKSGFRMLANPLKLNGERLKGRPCSALGEDTDAILADAGFSNADISRLRDQAVIGGS